MKDDKMKKLLPYAGLPVLLAVFVLVKRQNLDGTRMLMRAVLLSFVYAASVTDIREKIVPNRLVGLELLAWLLIMLPQLFMRTEDALVLLVSGLVGFGIAAVVFLAVYYTSRGGLGGGDVKLMAVSGLYLGYNGVLPTMLYGSVLAAIMAGILILFKKMGRKDSFPLVPFLFAGMVLTLFFQ